MKAQQRFNKLLSNTLMDYLAWCYRLIELKTVSDTFEGINLDRHKTNIMGHIYIDSKPTLEGFADWLEQTNEGKK